MAGNPFDQFDATATPQGTPASAGGNPFDQFDSSQGPAASAPQDAPDPVLQTVNELLKRGASSHTIHLYLQSVQRDNLPGVDNAATFIAANPDQKDKVAVASDGVISPKIDPRNRLEAGVGEFANGGTMGWLDKITAGVNAVAPLDALAGKNVDSIWSGKSLSDAYYHNLDLERGQSAADDKAYPGQSLALNATGAVASPLNRVFGAAGAAVKGESAIANAARLAIPDVLAGASFGAGQSNASTWGGEARDILGGGVAGAVGGAIGRPIAGGVAALGGGLARTLGFGADAAGAKLVAQKLAEDHIDPAVAADILQNGIGNGVPVMLADLGNNTRALAGSVSRQPGAARDIAMSATMDRQMGQGDRIRDAISGNLGPTTDVLAESERLIQQAKQAASPLYEKAYANPPIATPKLQKILETPAGKDALRRALTIAQNEGRDPKALGFSLDAAGNVTLNPIGSIADDGAAGLQINLTPQRKASYSTQTLDYVKRGLDDIIEGYRDQTSGKLRLDEAGRAINGVKSSLLTEMDRLNPDYKAARLAYAGPASLNSAMIDGQAALTKSASEINHRIKNMGPPELAQYALGLRSSMADAVDKGGDAANKVRMLIGTPAKRKALERVFGGQGGLQSFLDSLELEQRAFSTYQAVNGGSPTAARLAEDVGNTGAIDHLISWGDAASRGKTGLIGKAARSAGDALRYGAGKAGQRTRENASSLLFTSRPDDFVNALEAAKAAKALSGQRANAFANGVGRVAARGNSYLSTRPTINDFSPQN